MYEIGDFVFIKSDAYLIDGGRVGFAAEMKRYCGQAYKVIKIDSRGNQRVYKLENVCDSEGTVNDDGYWIWVEEWLEPENDNFKEFESDEMMNLFEA